MDQILDDLSSILLKMTDLRIVFAEIKEPLKKTEEQSEVLTILKMTRL